MRLISGDMLNRKIEQIWMNNTLKEIGPDGLIYIKRGERPFQTLRTAGEGRLMGAMMIYYMQDHNKMWLQIVDKMIARIEELSIGKGDYAYFYYEKGKFNNAQTYTPFMKIERDIPVPVGIWAANGNGRFVQHLGEYYALTKSERALRLGNKLANYERYQANFFGPNGEWLHDGLDPKVFPNREHDVHLGSHTHNLLYLLDFALTTGNRELAEWVRKSFEWGIARNQTITGQCATADRMGFFLEFMNPNYPTAEHCGVADMVSIALKLSRAGVGDYYDAADRWIRNHFAENQITRENWLPAKKEVAWPRKPDADETNERVVERNVGNFFGWPSACEGAPFGRGHMHCCAGNGARALYYVWENMLGYDEKTGTLQVNLLMNRASRWADVDSWIPNRGRVDVKIKTKMSDVALRAPEWIKSGCAELKVTVNGKPRPCDWGGPSDRYINVGRVKKGDVIIMSFPIEEKTIARRVYGAPVETILGGVTYDSITFRGNEVVDIQPKGKNYPYYQRDHYRSSEPRWRKVTRFVADQEVVY